MGLNDFLNWLSIIEKYPQSNLITNEDKDGYSDLMEFVSWIKNPNECVISGSSLLKERTGGDWEIGDIDIFTHNSSEHLPKLLKGSRNGTKLLSRMVERTLPPFDRGDINMTYKLVSTPAISDGYSSISLPSSSEIQSNKFYFGINSDTTEECPLNIIIISNRNGPDAYMQNPKLQLPVFAGKMSFYDAHMVDTIINIDHLDHINNDFDFEELKYVYDFDTWTIITSYRMLQKLLDQTIENNPKANGLVINSEYNNTLIEADQKLTSGISSQLRQLTLCNKVGQWEKQAIDGLIFHYGTPNADIDLRVYMQTTGRLELTRRRMMKYKGRGFTITDPSETVLCLNSIVQHQALILNKNTDLMQLQKQSLFKTSGANNGYFSFPGVKLLDIVRKIKDIYVG